MDGGVRDMRVSVVGLQKVHRHVYQSGCPSGGAVVCFCKWGKHRSSYGWWGA